MKNNVNWTEEMEARLETLVLQNHTAKEIGHVLKISSQSVWAKAKRMNLPIKKGKATKPTIYIDKPQDDPMPYPTLFQLILSSGARYY